MPAAPTTLAGSDTPTSAGVHASGQIANLGRRLGGWLMDGLVLLPVYMVVIATRFDAVRRVIDYINAHPGASLPASEIDRLRAAFVPITLLLLAVSFVYHTVLVAWRGQTVGKMVAHTRVAHIEDRRRPTLGRAAIRALVPAAAGLLPSPFGVVAVLVVFGWMAFNPLRQGLHDKAARTIVVYA